MEIDSVVASFLSTKTRWTFACTSVQGVKQSKSVVLQSTLINSLDLYWFLSLKFYNTKTVDIHFHSEKHKNRMTSFRINSKSPPIPRPSAIDVTRSDVFGSFRRRKKGEKRGRSWEIVRKQEEEQESFLRTSLIEQRGSVLSGNFQDLERL